MYRMSRSESLYEKASQLIPGGSQMYNKRPIVYEPCEYPIFVKNARGSRFTDVDGNEYIDYLLAYGAILLGYNYPPVMEAVIKQIREGTIFSINSELEIELAEKVTSTIPSAEMVRFFLSGSEATSAAVRMARAFSGKEIVLRWGYHGWHDWCATGQDGIPAALAEYFDIINAPRDCLRGVPRDIAQYTMELRYNDIDFLEKILKSAADNIACIIMEPFYFELPQPNFLEEVKKLVHQYEVLFIFDEVKTGCRVARGGAQEYFGITPDMSVFSKAVSNGYPFSMVVGKKEVMSVNEGLWYAGTNSGNTVGLRAALTTLQEVERNNVVEHLWRLGEKLTEGIKFIVNNLGIEGEIVGLPPMPSFIFTSSDKEIKKRQTNTFLCKTIERGILFPKEHCWFISYSHAEADIDITLQICEDAFRAAKEVR